MKSRFVHRNLRPSETVNCRYKCRHSRPSPASKAFSVSFHPSVLKLSMFPSASLFAACITAISGLAAATPVTQVPRQTALCNPNFEGAGVSIIDVGIEWDVSPAVSGTVLNRDLGGFPLNATAEWHVEQTGAFPPTYIVKEINHNNLVVDIGADGLLTLEEIDPTKATQIWQISCTQCLSGASSTPGGGEFASGCTIASAPSGLCVRVEPAGVNIGTGECTPVTSQRWDFWTTTS
ncbi:hypothetical protein C8R44DRAFT_991102 [Mycena epipterygia]|nr:hypothetical protein C8R44DRAFT_991102 [Mycena epipterygia]